MPLWEQSGPRGLFLLMAETVAAALWLLFWGPELLTGPACGLEALPQKHFLPPSPSSPAQRGPWPRCSALLGAALPLNVQITPVFLTEEEAASLREFPRETPAR